MNFVFKNEEICIQNEEWCISKDEFCRNAPRDETGHPISDSKITFLIEKLLNTVPLFKVMDADDRSMLVRPASRHNLTSSISDFPCASFCSRRVADKLYPPWCSCLRLRSSCRLDAWSRNSSLLVRTSSFRTQRVTQCSSSRWAQHTSSSHSNGTPPLLRPQLGFSEC